MGLPNPKNQVFGAAGDLGLAALLNPDLMAEAEAEKKKALQKQRETMGLDGSSVYGLEASKMLGLG